MQRSITCTLHVTLAYFRLHTVPEGKVGKHSKPTTPLPLRREQARHSQQAFAFNFRGKRKAANRSFVHYSVFQLFHFQGFILRVGCLSHTCFEEVSAALAQHIEGASPHADALVRGNNNGWRPNPKSFSARMHSSFSVWPDGKAVAVWRSQLGERGEERATATITKRSRLLYI